MLQSLLWFLTLRLRVVAAIGGAGYCLPLALGLGWAAGGAAAEVDLAAPSIEVKEVKAARPNKPLIISATVSDKVGVGEVLLFYKSSKAQSYQRVTMTRGGGGDVYFATLDKKVVRKPGLYYYIQARDQAGNTVLYGYSDTPKKIKVHKNAPVAANTLNLAGFTTPRDTKLGGKKKWLWLGLGAVALGAAAAGGGGGGEQQSETGDITIVAPLP